MGNDHGRGLGRVRRGLGHEQADLALIRMLFLGVRQIVDGQQDQAGNDNPGDKSAQGFKRHGRTIPNWLDERQTLLDDAKAQNSAETVGRG